MSRDPARGGVPPSADVRQLEEEKQTLESQLEEISAQLQGDGFTSLAQMRSVLFFKLLESFRSYSSTVQNRSHLTFLQLGCGRPGARCRGCGRKTKP